MTLNQQSTHPRIEERQGVATISQRKGVGWALLAISPGLPLAVWLSSGRPLTSALTEIASLDGIAIWVAGFLALILTAIAFYGLHWLLWRRELVIDTVSRRYAFVTGVWPWLTRHGGHCDEPLRVTLLRQRIGGMNAMGDAGSMSGPDAECWQLRLPIPGASEPLYLGDFADPNEARAAAERWRQWFPNLTVADAEQ